MCVCVLVFYDDMSVCDIFVYSQLALNEPHAEHVIFGFEFCIVNGGERLQIWPKPAMG